VQLPNCRHGSGRRNYGSLPAVALRQALQNRRESLKKKAAKKRDKKMTS
jgi:hypothetical protein